MSFEIITESLLAAIEARPILWDKSHEMHKNRIECKNTWNDVCLEMNSEYANFHDSLKDDFRMAILKRWTNIRDSYLKSLKKERTSHAPTKRYTYAKHLQFLHKSFDLPPVEDSLSNSSAGIENFNYIQVSTNYCSDEEGPSNDHNSVEDINFTSNDFRETSACQPKIEQTKPTLPKSTNQADDRHISFIRGILPSLHTLTDDEILEFQMGVLELIVKIKRNRLHCS